MIEHEAMAPPELVGDWLSAEGIELDVRRPYRGEGLPTGLHTHDGLLVLGGEMAAGDDVTYPWLTPTKELIATAVADQDPVWGSASGTS